MELQKRNKLILEHIRLVEALAKTKKRQGPHLEYDELFSVGLLALVDAADKYDETKGSFEPFAVRCIKNAITDCVRGWWRGASSLEDCDESVLVHYDKQGFEDIISGLNPSEQKIIRWHFVERLNYKQIGERLGVNKPRVAKRMRQFMDKLKTAM